jgi:hypothetical protein
MALAAIKHSPPMMGSLAVKAADAIFTSAIFIGPDISEGCIPHHLLGLLLIPDNPLV